MHRQSYWLIAVLIGLTVCGAGCIGPWRPSLEQVEPEPSAEEANLAAYLRADRLGRRVYERRELPADEGCPVASYARRGATGRMSEGCLESRHLLPLERYLEAEPASSPASQPSARKPPWIRMKGATVIFYALAEPLEPIPPQLEAGEPITSETPIRYFDYRGRLAAEGTLTRCVQVEGFEDVDCPAGRFEHCLRVRVDLNVFFPWVAIVDLTSYVWLSPEVGEVRRIQRLSGWFLIFWFGSVNEYDLVSYEPLDSSGEPGTFPPPKWHNGLLVLEGDFPHPRITGMVVDFAGP